MRDKVVPRHMRGPAEALEAVVGDLEPLLDPRARRSERYVERLSNELSDDERRAKFEEIIDKAEAVCRQVRIQQGQPKDVYDKPVLRPILDKLSRAQSIADELRERGIPLARQRLATSKRKTYVDRIHLKITEHADVLRDKVTPDTLWNAYRADFKGRDKPWLTTEEWQANPFIQHMPKTIEVLQPIIQARAMYKLARQLDDIEEDQAKTARAIERFTAKLSPYHTLLTPEFKEFIQTLQNPACDQAQRDTARYALATRLHENAGKMMDRQASENGLKELHKHIVEAYQQDRQAYCETVLPAAQDRNGLHEQEEADSEHGTEMETLKNKEFAKVLDAAPHLRDLINAVRAEAALRVFEPVLYRHWDAVEKLYPYQPPGEGQGEGVARFVGGDKKGRTSGAGS